MSNIVIKAENLSKQYRLGEVGTGTIQHDLKRWWYKVRGKEDPFLKVGEANDRAKRGDSEFVWALKDINFEIEQGDVVGIIGRNGAGKSTLLKILSKTTLPTIGNIKVKGRIASLLEVGTGFHPELTGRDNIFLNGAILGMTRREIKAKFDEIVDFAGVERYIDTPVKRYSSGMYVRLAFAVAAFLEPDILIVDEVLAVGDAEFQKKAIGKMRDVSTGEGRTVLFVSHNMAAVQNLCKSGIVMKQGTIDFHDNISACIDKYLKTNNTASSVNVKDKKYISPYKTQITAVKLLNVQSNSPQSTFKMGEDIKVQISFEIPEKFDFLNINVRMNDLYGNGIAAWRTKEMGVEIPCKKNLSVELIVKNLNVFDGFYNFSVSIEDSRNQVLDYIESLISFEIVAHETEIFGKHVSKSHNLIYTPGEWLY